MLLNGSMINLLFLVILLYMVIYIIIYIYILLYYYVGHNLTLELQIVWKISAFQCYLIESIEMLKKYLKRINFRAF